MVVVVTVNSADGVGERVAFANSVKTADAYRSRQTLRLTPLHQ